VVEQIGGRGAFSRARKTENRQKLIEAAGQVFERMGYSPASVDDIARAAGVSRQTFYRHFDGKVSVGLALYQELRERAMTIWQDIGGDEAGNLEQVRGWLARMFAVFRTEGGAIRTFIEMGIVEPAFFQLSKAIVRELIGLLAERIPAFAASEKTSPAELRHQVEAWLLVFQIVDHSSNAAVDFLDIDLECLIDVLATDFVAFVERHTPCEYIASGQAKN
jgi:AcrR family transcriptional regulator